jgi:hypothetical protein
MTASRIAAIALLGNALLMGELIIEERCTVVNDAHSVDIERRGRALRTATRRDYI